MNCKGLERRNFYFFVESNFDTVGFVLPKSFIKSRIPLGAYVRAKESPAKGASPESGR
jgi:hypothetical protein